jgi:hypothetical protein
MPNREGCVPLFSLRLSLCTSPREEEEEEEEEKALEPPETLNPKPRGMQKSRSHTGLERQKRVTAWHCGSIIIFACCCCRRFQIDHRSRICCTLFDYRSDWEHLFELD